MVLRGGILELPGDWVLQSTAGLWLERTFGCVFATPNFQHFLHLIAQRTRNLPCVALHGSISALLILTSRHAEAAMLVYVARHARPDRARPDLDFKPTRPEPRRGEHQERVQCTSIARVQAVPHWHAAILQRRCFGQQHSNDNVDLL